MRTRVYWSQLDSTDVETWWTAGWLPDSDVLRFSLVRALQVDGGRERADAYRDVDGAAFAESYVAFDDDTGEYVAVAPNGEDAYGNRYDTFTPATTATFTNAGNAAD